MPDIGSRWERFLEGLTEAHEGNLVEDNELEFVEDMIERLSRYEERTHVSLPQINWINSIIARNTEGMPRSRYR